MGLLFSFDKGAPQTRFGAQCDLVDPHLISLEDAPRKAAALAQYAEEHQDRFGRIDLIIVEKQDGEEKVKRLRLMDESTRRKVAGVTTNQHLKDLFDWKG